MLGLFGTVPVFIYVIIALVLIVLFCYFQSFRILIGTVLSVVLIGSAVYSGVKLDKYFNAEGGLYGHLVSAIKPVNEIEENAIKKEFTLNNTMFVKDGNDYVIELQISGNFKLESGKEYQVLVNDKPCSYINGSNEYLIFSYDYAFYDINFNLLTTDTLNFNLIFYKNYCYLKIYSSSNEDTIRLWQSYFQKESFVVSISEIETAQKSNI